MNDHPSSSIPLHRSENSTSKQPPPLPLVTTGSSKEFIKKAALAAANASITDPVTLHFQSEKHDIFPANATIEQLHQGLYESNIIRLEDMTAKGSIVAEAGDFAAVACWSPPDPTVPPRPENEMQSFVKPNRAFLTHYMSRNEDAKSRFLYPKFGHRYWHLSLMGRDPKRPHVPGAVRAVVEPFIKRARDEKVPIWLCAGSHHARDVYAHFGFQAVDTFMIADVELTCMILEPL